MQGFDIKKFLDAYHLLVSLSAAVTNRDDVQSLAFDLDANALAIGQAAALAGQLDEVGLRMSAITARHVLTHMNNRASMNDVSGQIQRLHGRINDEFRLRAVLLLPEDREAYYVAQFPFGEEVQKKFGRRGNYEIEEASKCLALGRSTACAFHLIRTVECGIDAIRRCLRIPAPIKSADKTWGAILGLIEKEIGCRDNLAHASPWMRLDDKRLFTQMHAAAALIKNWRDPTMHLEMTYTDVDAVHLFSLTKGFMQKVASRLDEDGLPVA